MNIVYPDVDEHIHHEDVFKRDRLNKQIDINDIDINGVLHAMQKHDESLQPMNSATIRFFHIRTRLRSKQVDYTIQGNFTRST